MTKKIGVLISNLGSPAEPTTKSLRVYLREFLSDPRVIEIPRFIWLPILYGIVLPFRSRYSAKLYKKIWTEQGSPLVQITKKQAKSLQSHFDNLDFNIQVVWGMRYGTPTIKNALQQLKTHEITDLIVLPLYPQYSNAATGSTHQKVLDDLKSIKWAPSVHFINQYAEDVNYIQAISNSIKEFWQHHDPSEKILFSFHGIPLRSIAKGDAYYSQCHRTARLIADSLNLPDEQWMVVFQSRFGREAWLQPYCDIMLQNLATRGIKKVDVICPGFSADCLETLEEIKERNAEVFIDHGGHQLNYIPALNIRPDHINALANIITGVLNQR